MDESKLVFVDNLSAKQISSVCDHTFLKRAESYIAGNLQSQVRLREYAFNDFLQNIKVSAFAPYALCVRPEHAAKAVEYLSLNNKSSIKVCSVVGFPDGSAYDTEFKVAETGLAIAGGASEIDMVLNYDKLKSGDIAYAKKDVESVVNAAHEKGALAKLIIETSELNSEQIKQACQIAGDAGADFVKTSTGFSAYGARVEDAQLIRSYFSKGVKISGGVNKGNLNSLLAAVSGRADRLIALDPLFIRIGESSLLNSF